MSMTMPGAQVDPKFAHALSGSRRETTTRVHAIAFKAGPWDYTVHYGASNWPSACVWIVPGTAKNAVKR